MIEEDATITVREAKQLTGRIAAEQIRMMAVPRPPAAIIERFMALGDPTGVVSDVMDEMPATERNDARGCRR
jgi:hypothetical protein